MLTSSVGAAVLVSASWCHRFPAVYPRASPVVALLDAPDLVRNGQAAFAASCVATVLMHPLDTLKTRLQFHTEQDRSAVTAEASSGGGGLYSGCAANVLKEAPDAAIFLALSAELSRTLPLCSPWFATHLTATLLLAGATGDAVGSVLRLPAEVLCKRQQCGECGAGWLQALTDTPAESWSAAWTAILVRDIPFGGLQIAAYQQAQHFLGVCASQQAASGLDGSALPDSVSDVLAGLAAGAIAAALTTPLDVLVTHATTQPAPPDGSRPPSPLQLGVRLVKEQGPLALTRGASCRVLYYAPHIALFFALYEQFREALAPSTVTGAIVEQVIETTIDALETIPIS